MVDKRLLLRKCGVEFENYNKNEALQMRFSHREEVPIGGFGARRYKVYLQYVPPIYPPKPLILMLMPDVVGALEHFLSIVPSTPLPLTLNHQYHITFTSRAMLIRYNTYIPSHFPIITGTTIICLLLSYSPIPFPVPIH